MSEPIEPRRLLKLDQGGIYSHRGKVAELFIELTQALATAKGAARLADTAVRAVSAERSPFTPTEARRIFNPIARFLELTRPPEEVAPILRDAVESRPALATDLVSRFLEPQRVRKASDLPALPDSDGDHSEVAELWLRSGQGDDAWRPSEPERLALMQAWTAIRPSQPVPERAMTDARLLDFALTQVHRIETSYAESLWLDRTVWACEPLLRWAATLRQPLNGGHVGVAAAGLLNARLAEIVPVLYLNNPSAVVMSTVGRAAEIDELQKQYGAQLGSHVLSTIDFLGQVLARKGAPKRDELQQVYDNVADGLALLGLRRVHAVGELLDYDSAVQDSPDALPHGRKVRVMRPGLQDVTSNEVVAKPKVEALEPGDSATSGKQEQPEDVEDGARGN